MTISRAAAEDKAKEIIESCFCADIEPCEESEVVHVPDLARLITEALLTVQEDQNG